MGKAMLQGLESEARKLGIEAVELVSTRTAHAFYLRNGYRETGECGVLWSAGAPNAQGDR